MKQFYLPRCGHIIGMSIAYLGLLLLSACSSNSDSQIHFIQDDDQQFRVETADYSLALDAEGVSMSDASSDWKMSFYDAQANTKLERMQTEEVLYRGLYEGTDLRVYHKGNARAAYDFLLAPGASVESIRLSLKGNDDAFINADGELVLPTDNGEIRHSQPFAYQEINGEQVEVESHFLLADGQLGFEVGDYDPSLALTIDPEIYTIKKVVEISESGTAMMPMMAPDCPPVPVTNPYIGGSVYEDFAQNGVMNAGIDQPLAGVTVTAYASDGTNVGSATTTVDGDYLITSASIVGGQSYRVEFTNFPTNYEPTFVGGDNGTSVQFVSANSCNVDLGLIDPRIYSEPNPTVVTSCFTEFDQTAGDVLISWEYDAIPQANEANDGPVLVSHESDASQIGTTYGLAYHKRSGKMFAASFMKRFSGFQSGGPGGIYVVSNPRDGVTNGQLYLNLTTLHPTVGGTDPHNFTLTTASGDVIDGASFNAVGRRAYGDIELNDDEDELYAISLNDRRLYTIPVAADPSAANAPTMASQVPFIALNTTASFPGLNTGLTAGVGNAEIIPFALKFWKGRLYIGCVGNGQAGGPMVAFVYEYNPNTQALTSKVLEFTLVYNRGCAFAESPSCWGPAAWQPWWNANTYPPITMDSPYTVNEQGYPQAIFADIEFLSDGTMVVGLRDRFGDQGGFRVPRPDDAPGGAFSDVVNDAFGDILVAQKGAGNTWSLNIADFTDNTVGNAAGTLPIAGSEPSFGADGYVAGPFIHEETAMGGLAILHRSNGIITPSMDPRVNAFSNGIDWFNSDGTLNKAITILTNTNSPFGKSNGLGEIEFATRQAPIEIGNRIWKDADGNGIQDPGEDGINGVLVELYKETAPATFTKVAETTTAANGDQGNGAYKFSASGTAGQTWMGGQTEVLPNMNYQIRVSLTNVQSIDPACTGFSPANQTADATNDRFTDLADSDGMESAGVATISFSTTDVGESNHTLDMGVVACSVTLSNLAVSACSSGLYTLTGDVAYAGGPSPLGLMTISVDNDGTPVSVQIDPSSVSSFSIPNLGCDGDANVVVTASFDNDNTCSDTETYNEPLCSMDIAITNITACSGGTYSIEGTIAVTNAPLGGSIVISFTESGTPHTMTLAATATTFQFTGLTCDGDNNITVSAAFDNLAGCSDSESYDEPCYLEITNVQVTDNCIATGTYDITVTYTVYNAPGDLTIDAAGSMTTVTYAAGDDAVGATASITGIACATMAGGSVTVTADLGGGCSDTDTYTPPILPASIGNFVWEDNNLNGVQDPGEPGVPNILVRLFECNAGVKGAEVTSQLTDINGMYSFTGLTPNMEYCVEFDLDNSTNTDADSYIFTTQDQTLNGGDDTNDSDANPTDGCTPGYTPTPGEDYTDFDAGIYKFDFGDLPENNNYPTTTANNGAAHVVPISPQLYLGATVDAEPDGQPEAMAGAMAGGDDGNGDDEDGITFVTPLVAGYQACIEVDAVNSSTGDAVLQAWIDFDNDGTLDAGDELTTGDFAPSGATVPNGGLSGEVLCFDVPATATFNGGQAFSRFRLSSAGGLSTTGIAFDGEVEDYKTTLSKVGNYVWLDSNNNGEQDEAATAGVNGVEVTLTFGGPDNDIATAGDNLTYVTTTANVGADGLYYFCGLIPGKYELSLSSIPTGYSPTTLINATADADTDSEDAAGVEFMIMDPAGLTTGEDGTNDSPGTIDNFPDNQDEINYDFALIAEDYGDLPDTYTTIGGPSHIIDTDLFLGACIDAEPDGQPEPMAGMMTGGDDNNGSTVFEFGACAGADEDGVSFPTPLIAGNQACVEVSAVNNTGSNAVLQGWIDFNGNGTFEAAEELTSVDFAPSGATIPNGGLTNALLCFDVPATATFDGGAAFSRFRLSTTGGLSYDGPGGSGEVEDHKQILSKVGNLVWLDENNNGFQDEPNSGVNGATVQLEWGGPDGDVGTAGDNQIYQVNTFQDGGIDGIYYFCGLIPGTYELSIPNLPLGYDPGQVDIIPGNDVEDADDPTGVEFTITDPDDLFTGEDGVGDMPGGTDGFADNQDELIYDFVLVVDEYGDLPDSYTTTGNSAAAHIIDTDLYLGTCIDAELDGQPEPMAGMMTGGDDNNGSTLFEHGTCTGGDDEDGIQFVTPMIPGYQACIEATAFNNTGGDIYLQGWIDFAGNGVFDGSDELTTGDFAGGSVIVPDGGFTDQTLCFDVPATATFDGGAAFARFRLSSTGGLSFDGAAIDGEVEDYKESLAKVGNLVWEDRNYDGIQGTAIDEPGINNIEVILTWYGVDGVEGGTDDVAYNIFTANVGGKDGIYYFCGLIAGEYDLEVITDRYPTLLGQTVETQDSDDESGESVSIVSVTGLLTMEDGTSDMPGMINNFPDNQDNQSFDFGYTGIDFGDLPDGFNTTMANNGAAHSWKPGLYLGSCLDFETDGAPTGQADGDDTAPGLFNDGTCAGPDDEDGVVLVTPLIPGAEACVEITATSTDGGAFVNGWIDFDGNGAFDVNEQLIFNAVDGAPITPTAEGVIPNGTSTQVFCFDVPATATFEGGETHMRFRLSMNGGTATNGLVISGEVEDYWQPLAKAGNLVWEDLDFDGIQDIGEPGLAGVTVELTWYGPNGVEDGIDDVTYTLVTDGNGNYYFCGLTPGTYEIAPTDPTDMTPSPAMTTDDFNDSEHPSLVINIGDVFNLPTGEDGLTDNPGGTDNFPDNQEDISIDFAYIGIDYGDLPDGFATLQGSNGAAHLMQDGKYLGSCVDAELDGAPDAQAGDSGTTGDDGTVSAFSKGTCNGDDDEDGVKLITPLVPGNTSCIEVTSTLPTGGGFLNAWIDFDGDGLFGAGEQVVFTGDGMNGVLAAGTDVVTELCFEVPADAVFEGLETHMRFRLSCDGNLGPDGLALDGEVEDYYQPLAKLGNFVWEDLNGNGIQDTGEPGIAGIDVTLDVVDANGNPYQVVVTTDATGMYMFTGLLPTPDVNSPYTLTFTKPGLDWVATAEDSPNTFGIPGDDTDNSDLDEVTLTIDNIVLAPLQYDEDQDAGYLLPADVGNYVWVDLDELGDQGDNIPVENAKLTLTGVDGLGRPVMLVLFTDQNGEYLFEDLWPGEYMIEFDLTTITGPIELVPFVDQLVFTIPNVVVDDQDSDVDQGDFGTSPIAKTSMFTLISQDVNLTFDAGVAIPCLQPINLMADNLMPTNAQINWTATNDPFTGIDLTNHCWRILVGGEGFAVDNSMAVVDVIVCAGPANGPTPGLTINGANVSYTIEGLAPGTCYDYYIVETCDGSAPPSNVTDFTGIGQFCTPDMPFLAEIQNLQVASCPGGSDGSFDIVITDGNSCGPNIYNVTQLSGPTTLTPSMLTNQGEGVFTFTGAAEGTYTIEFDEIGPCTPFNDPEVVTVVVGPGVDTEDPIFYLTDIFGNILADTDPNTPLSNTLDLGDLTMPEGECDRQDQFLVYGTDNCEQPFGFITTPGAVTVSAETTPATIIPGTQVVSPAVLDGSGINYLIDIHWSAGQTLVTIEGEDASANAVQLFINANVIADEDDLAIVAQPITAVIPACAESIEVLFGVTITGGCDATLTGEPDVELFGTHLSNLQLVFVDLTSNYFEYSVVVTPGATPLSDFITIEYTSALGTTESTSIGVTSESVLEDQDPVIYANAENYTIPACEEAANVIYSFTVCDDCQEMDVDAIIFDDDGAGLSFFYSDDAGNNCVYVEYSGAVMPGTYFPTITYGPTNAIPSLVVTQDADQLPVIDMPGNLNFTIPVCEESIDQMISLTLSDDCDEFISTDGVNIDDLTLTLAGQTLTPSYFVIGQHTVYVEYVITVTTEMSGELLVASYGGVTVDAQIVVTGQPDVWAPLIIYPSQDIDVELDPCESNIATVIFEVTATDNCGDEDIDLTVTVNPANAGGLILDSPGGDSYVGFFEANESYQILITATDVAGNSRQEDFFVNVTQDAPATPNLSCRDNINVTLGEDCQAEMQASLLLTGEFGCLTEDDFDITVVDNDPSNGAIVDGCGEFPYQIQLATPEDVAGFTGPFAPGNWSILEENNGTVDFSADNQSIAFVGPDGGTCTNGEATAMIAIPADGTVTFDYDWSNLDVGWDAFVVTVNVSTGIIDTENFGTATGTVEIDVVAGDVLLIGVVSEDCFGGAGNALVDNFSFEYASDLNGGVFENCWGYVNAEDKDDPVLECPDETNQALLEATTQTLDGTIADTDPTIQALQYPCFYEVLSYQNPGANDVEDEFHYDLFTFTVTQSDNYTFFFESDDFTGANGGAMALMFEGGFDADEPCSNVIFQNDQQVASGALILFPSTQGGGFYSNFNPLVRITLPLEAGQTYTLLTTGTFATTLGDYTWTVYSDGNGVVQGTGITAPQTATALVELVCDDINELSLETLPDNVPHCYTVDADGNVIYPTNFQERQRLQQLLDLLAKTGYPVNGDPFNGLVTDNCGDITVCIEDVLTIDPNCAPNTIERTFTAVDAKGNEAESCTQVISARKLTLADVMAPPLTAFVECDEGDFENENPSPAITGYPFVQTAHGFENLGVEGAQEYCNLAAQYTDQPRIEVCPGAYKFVRSWNVLNWCNPIESQLFVQIIKVGDFSAPEVTCPEVDYDWDGEPDMLTFSTGPFDCTAAFEIPAPVVTDNCSGYTVSTEVLTTVQDTIYDQWGINIVDIVDVDQVIATIAAGEPQYVTGIPLGCHRFRYTVTDECGNTAVQECPFQVEDQVEPIAVCDDDLNISISGDAYARVYADDIDEGSSDNCGPIRIEVRRLYTENADCNTIPPFYSPWGDYVEFNCCDVNDMVTIELRVWDDRNGDGIPGNTIPVTYCDGTTKLVTDNSNTCWLEVLVEDKIRPICTPPHAEVRDCNDLPYNFSATDTLLLQELFGNATADDNCPTTVYTQELPPINNLDDCGFGTIIRRFRAIDAQGNVSTNSCQQLITINEVHEYEIKFPKDAEAFCGEPNPDTLFYEELGCDLLAVEIVDDTLSASGDECYKIFRQFQVVNWCEYDGISQAVTVSRDEDCDSNPGDEDVWVLVRPNGVTYFDRDNDETNNNPFAFTKGTSCDGLTNPTGHWINSTIDVDATRDPITGVVQQGAEPIPNIRDIASRGYWKYEQHIKVYDNVDPTITVDAYDAFCSEDGVECTGAVEITFSVEENCTPDDMEVIIYLDVDADGSIDLNSDDNPSVVSLSGSYPNYTITGTYPIGDHEFGIRVDDGCGNYSTADVPFTVVDCKAPAPVCINGLAIELMPQPAGTDADGDGDDDCAAMAIWANDFIASPVYDCTGQGDPSPTNSNVTEILKYSIHRADSVVAGSELPDPSVTGLVATCDDPATLIVRIYAWDDANNPYSVQPDGSVGGPNYDFCETYILVQDNQGACEGAECGGVGSRIAGVIMTEDDEEVEGVEVGLSGQTEMEMITEADGAYEFTDLENGYDYTVTPLLDLDHANGVSTFDLVLISKHILGVTPLNSPYKMIAADANNSKSITTLDIIQIRKLILNINTDFPSNTSWRFVDAAYVFPDPTDPWAEVFPEVLNYNNLNGDQLDQDFVAVKIGDVNGSAQTNLASVDDRTTNGLFAFELEDEVLKNGNDYTLDFRASDLNKIQGYQLTLTFDEDQVSFTGMTEAVNAEEHFGFQYAEQGVITMSWNMPNGQLPQFATDEVLFSLHFRAQNTIRWSEVLGVSSSYTMAEAYNAQGELMEVGLHFSNGPTLVQDFELYQNRPNPFRELTFIGFYLPQSTTATLVIRDASGRELKKVKAEYDRGYHEVVIKASELPKGVLYYTLQTDDHTATRNMMIIE